MANKTGEHGDRRREPAISERRDRAYSRGVAASLARLVPPGRAAGQQQHSGSQQLNVVM